jgi:hypothetical protein
MTDEVIRSRYEKLPYFTVLERQDFRNKLVAHNVKYIKGFRRYLESSMYEQYNKPTTEQIDDMVAKEMEGLEQDLDHEMMANDQVVHEFKAGLSQREHAICFQESLNKITSEPFDLERAASTLLPNAVANVRGKLYKKIGNEMVLLEGNK